MDNQASARIAQFGSMKEYLQEVAERIMAISISYNIQLEVRWISRELGEICLTDQLSKEVDTGDYRLDRGSFDYIRDRMETSMWIISHQNGHTE